MRMNSLLEGDVASRAAEPGAAVSALLVSNGELTQVVTNHVRLEHK